MIIVISPLTILSNEVNHINDMFANRLDLFHFRKYDLEDESVMKYLDKINPSHMNKVVLHSHKHLAKEFGIERLHFNTEGRMHRGSNPFIEGYSFSTSAHQIDEFNSLDEKWSYAFLSPAFKSISKPGYGQSMTVLSDFKLRENKKVKLIGLGGICAQNLVQVLDSGADGVALLGSVWNQSNPVKYFAGCKNTEIIWKGIDHG